MTEPEKEAELLEVLRELGYERSVDEKRCLHEGLLNSTKSNIHALACNCPKCQPTY